METKLNNLLELLARNDKYLHIKELLYSLLYVRRDLYKNNLEIVAETHELLGKIFNDYLLEPKNAIHNYYESLDIRMSLKDQNEENLSRCYFYIANA